MLTATGHSLRLEADAQRVTSARTRVHLASFGLFIVGGWALIWFLFLFVVGVSTGRFFGLGGSGRLGIIMIAIIGIAIGLGLIALGAWSRKSVSAMDAVIHDGLVFEVSPAGVLTSETELTPFSSIHRIDVHHVNIVMPPRVFRLGALIADKIVARRGAPSRTVRTVVLTLADGSQVESAIGPFATDPEFERIVDALAHEAQRNSIPVEYDTGTRTSFTNVSVDPARVKDGRVATVRSMLSGRSRQ